MRYRGLAKNLAKAYTLFALANLYLVRRRLLPPGARCVLQAPRVLNNPPQAPNRGLGRSKPR